MAEDLRVVSEIGAGAVAVVMRVEDAEGRAYAAKLLHSSRKGDARAVERFEHEAQLVQLVEHPNVVRSYGRCTIDGRDAVLMELVDGVALDVLIAQEAPLSTSRLIELARGIAAGLAAAHDAGIIHRDLKPANILVATGDVAKIADFGMARASSFLGVSASSFTALGTPDYMAPESLDPLAVDARTDLYALGCIMFEMATGNVPFAGPTAFAVLQRHRTAAVPDVPASTGYPSQLRELIKRLLAKQPSERPQSASAVLAALDGLMDTSTALVPVETAVLAMEAHRCARCSEPLVEALDLCLNCRLPVPRVERGGHTVFVVGPGELADKLDVGLRHKLVQWLKQHPSLGLDARRLSRTIPRVPFALVAGVSEHAAGGIAASVRELGIEVQIVAGGVTALPAARRKAWKMGSRTSAIIAALGSGSLPHIAGNGNFYAFVVVAVLLWLVGPAVVGLSTLRSLVALAPADDALPEELRRRLHQISSVGGQLRARRHRESLRGVVGRVMDLRIATPADSRGDTDPELAAALDLALVATGRLDELDAQLQSQDLREGSAAVRELMHERDVWSSRLLDLSATLEGFRGRLAAAAGQAGGEFLTGLEDLRAKVEALEEVQSDRLGLPADIQHKERR